jgi:hypothetical protein
MDDRAETDPARQAANQPAPKLPGHTIILLQADLPRQIA